MEMYDTEVLLARTPLTANTAAIIRNELAKHTQYVKIKRTVTK